MHFKWDPNGVFHMKDLHQFSFNKDLLLCKLLSDHPSWIFNISVGSLQTAVISETLAMFFHLFCPEFQTDFSYVLAYWKICILICKLYLA